MSIYTLEELKIIVNNDNLLKEEVKKTQGRIFKEIKDNGLLSLNQLGRYLKQRTIEEFPKDFEVNDSFSGIVAENISYMYPYLEDIQNGILDIKEISGDVKAFIIFNTLNLNDYFLEHGDTEIRKKSEIFRQVKSTLSKDFIDNELSTNEIKNLIEEFSKVLIEKNSESGSLSNYFMVSKTMENLISMIDRYIEMKKENNDDWRNLDFEKIVELLLMNEMKDLNSLTFYDESHWELLEKIMEHMKDGLIGLRKRDLQLTPEIFKVSIDKTLSEKERKSYEETMVVVVNQCVSFGRMVKKVISVMDSLDIENVEEMFDKLIDIAITIDKDNLEYYGKQGITAIPSLSFLLFKNNIINNKLLEFVNESAFTKWRFEKESDSIYTSVGIERASQISSNPLFSELKGGKDYKIMNKYIELAENVIDKKTNIPAEGFSMLIEILKVHQKFEPSRVESNLVNYLRNIPEYTLAKILSKDDKIDFKIWNDYEEIMGWNMDSFENYVKKDKEISDVKNGFFGENKEIFNLKIKEKELEKILDLENNTMNRVYVKYLTDTQRSLPTNNSFIKLMSINNILKVNLENFNHYKNSINNKDKSGDKIIENPWDSVELEKKLLVVGLFKVLSDMIDFEKDLDYKSFEKETYKDNFKEIIQSMNIFQYQEMFEFFKKILETSLDKTEGFDMYERKDFKVLDIGLNAFGLNINLAEIENKKQHNFDYLWRQIGKFSTNRIDLLLGNKSEEPELYFERLITFFDNLLTNNSISNSDKKREIKMLISYWDLEEDININDRYDDLNKFEYIKEIVKHYIKRNPQITNNIMSDNELFEKYIPKSHKEDLEIQGVIKDFIEKFKDFSEKNPNPLNLEEINMEIQNHLALDEDVLGDIKSKFDMSVSIEDYTKKCISKSLSNLAFELGGDKDIKVINKFIKQYYGKTTIEENMEKLKFWKEKMVFIYEKIFKVDNPNTLLQDWFLNRVDGKMFADEEVKYILGNKDINFSNLFFLNQDHLTPEIALSLGIINKIDNYAYDERVLPEFKKDLVKEGVKLVKKEMQALKNDLSFENMLRVISVCRHMSYTDDVLEDLWKDPKTPVFNADDIIKMLEKTKYSKLSKKEGHIEGADDILFLLMELGYLKLEEKDLEVVSEYLVKNVVEKQSTDDKVQRSGYMEIVSFSKNNLMAVNILGNFMKNKIEKGELAAIDIEKIINGKVLNKLIEMKKNNENLLSLEALIVNFRNNKSVYLNDISFENLYETNLGKDKYSYNTTEAGEKEKLTSRNIEVIFDNSKKGNFSPFYNSAKLDKEITEDGLKFLCQKSIFGKELEDFAQKIKDSSFEDVIGNNQKLRTKIVNSILGQVAYGAIETEAAINVLNINPQKMMGSSYVVKKFHLGKDHLFENLVEELVGQKEVLGILNDFVEKITKKAYLKAFSGSACLVLDSIGGCHIEEIIGKYPEEIDAVIQENISSININNYRKNFYTSNKDNKLENNVVSLEEDVMIAKNEMSLKKSWGDLWNIFDNERKRLLFNFLTGQVQSNKEYFVKMMCKDESLINKHIREKELFERITQMPTKTTVAKKKI